MSAHPHLGKPADGLPTTDELFDVLRLLHCPTEFAAPDGEASPGDVPQLLGAVAAAAEMITVAADAYDANARDAWAAGWLGLAGADRGICGATRAFDLLTLRLQATDTLFDGLRTDAPMARLVMLLAEATAHFASAASLSTHVVAGQQDPDEARVPVAEAMAGGGRALRRAVAVLDELEATVGRHQP